MLAHVPVLLAAHPTVVFGSEHQQIVPVEVATVTIFVVNLFILRIFLLQDNRN
jgi:hypothetical protein